MKPVSSSSPRKELDWPAIHERMARATAVLEEALLPSPERSRRILEERAARLAAPAPPERIPGLSLDLVVFALGAERYAIETGFVMGLAKVQGLTPVPGAPDHLFGIANLRGEILAVFELRRFFGLPVQGLTDLSRLVVLGRDRSEFALLADEVLDVVAIDADAVGPPPESLAGIGRRYLHGVTADALIVLHGAVLLSDDRFYIGSPAGERGAEAETPVRSPTMPASQSRGGDRPAVEEEP